ncbi:MAG TPA: diphthamide synthesis protein [Candidatus Nanoarchaeia archaeon]|nr:diphthamide synthesis protein [Candidatus Nanoarchaeia archaeon]
MKTLFIEARYKGKVVLPKEVIEKLPKKIGLASSIQFIGSLKGISSQLGKGSLIAGQILGCDAKSAGKIAERVDSFLYIGDGEFHPIAIALETKKPVYKYNPKAKTLTQLDKAKIDSYERKKKGAYLKFLNAKKVGILLTTKPGQRISDGKLKQLEQKFKDKKFYRFIADTIDYTQLENFPFIEAWVNTACPRIEEDILALNISEL